MLPGRLGFLLLALSVPTLQRSESGDLVSKDSARDLAGVPVLEGALRVEGDLERLLDVAAIIGLRLAIHADDAEVNLGLCRLGPASNTGTFGEPTLL